MVRKRVFFAVLVLPVSLLLANPGYSQEPAKGAPGGATPTQTREQQQAGALEQERIREQEQQQVEQSSGDPSAGRQQQRNGNTGEAPAQGAEVREGPYGDKQYGQRQGTPQMSGKHSSPQKKGK